MIRRKALLISAVVLTKNEENKIVDCLESLLWCDEIIVVDDYSEDRTLEIIQNSKFKIQNDNAKLKIYRRHLNNDFAGQRNFGLEKASGEWVLFVDADERAPAALAAEITNDQLPITNFDGFYIRRKDFLFGRWLEYGETGNIKLLRLVRKNAGRWERRVHEELRVVGDVGVLRETLLHYPHQTISEFLKEINFYTDLNAQEFYKNGVKVPRWAIIVYPLAKFMQNYFLKLGFLDGMAGFLQATLMSFHSFLTRGKLWEMWDHD